MQAFFFGEIYWNRVVCQYTSSYPLYFKGM